MYIYQYEEVVEEVLSMSEFIKHVMGGEVDEQEMGTIGSNLRNWGDNGLIRLAKKGTTRYFFSDDKEVVLFLLDAKGKSIGYDTLKIRMKKAGFTPADEREDVKGRLEKEKETQRDTLEINKEDLLYHPMVLKEIESRVQQEINQHLDEIKEQLTTGMIKSYERIQQNLMSEILEKNRLLDQQAQLLLSHEGVIKEKDAIIEEKDVQIDVLAQEVEEKALLYQAKLEELRAIEEKLSNATSLAEKRKEEVVEKELELKAMDKQVLHNQQLLEDKIIEIANMKQSYEALNHEINELNALLEEKKAQWEKDREKAVFAEQFQKHPIKEAVKLAFGGKQKKQNEG